VNRRSARNRAKRQPTDQAAPDTIDEIVAKLRHPAALQAASERWRALQRAHTEKSNELREAVAELDKAGGESAPDVGRRSRRITAIDTELHELAKQVQTALEDIAAARPVELTVTRLTEFDLPLDWTEQHRLLAT
jgi:hypothetical protein